MVEMFPIMLLTKLPPEFIESFFNPGLPNDMDDGTCRLEQFLHDEDLPIFCTEKQGGFAVPSFWDFRNFERELIRRIKSEMRDITPLRDESEIEKPGNFDGNVGTSEGGNNWYPIQFSYIDFRMLIMGEKLRETYKEASERQPVIFDEYYLANLICSAAYVPGNEKLFDQATIKSLIDHQYSNGTRFYFVLQLLVHLFCFLIPLNLILLQFGDWRLQYTLSVVALCAQVYLFLHEVAQMLVLGLYRYLTLTYFNGCDFLCFWLYVVFFVREMSKAGNDIVAYKLDLISEES
jgi:hypothetical protein